MTEVRCGRCGLVFIASAENMEKHLLVCSNPSPKHIRGDLEVRL